ncbi:hypothetical protein [Chitinophaga sancti]|uniref:Uncharacterized protein n=1 Tax=Chitinophaga sancti TaxID=1004 RepID=A0A1K1MGE0_9BACT|nr:hypothetical protein [Chitinophaga sancti]WQD62665.1 hypothetical protein U0033_32745 [Chitinophaga sancti]WQG91711.1 hypothetical protein SR876_09360 [Chitinophaga sancti]SFW22221.1 hypothetical protein SAMN05661012_00553 [Chitinophaga sancti]
MKPTFCVLAAVSLSSLLLFSCTKKDNTLRNPTKPNEKSDLEMVNINKGQYEYINSIFSDTKLTSSYIAKLKDSVNNLKSAKTSGSYNPAYPNQYDANYADDIYSTYEGDQANLVGGTVGRSRYDIQMHYEFKARPIQLIVVLPFYYNDLTPSHPTASQAGPVQQILIGDNLGSQEPLGSPFLNIIEGFYSFFGNAAGNLIEKRTLIGTSDGNTMVKGGINAAGVEVGATLSNGLKVESTTNSLTNAQWSVSYKADFLNAWSQYNPKITLNGFATLRGSIPQ